MINKKRYICCIFFILLCAIIKAQIATLQTNPSVGKLPVRSVHRIYQDSEGYMWYGTVDGLCRDDGYSIYVFRSDFLHPAPLKSNLIYCIAEDSIHNILFGTPSGAFYVDKANNYQVCSLLPDTLANKTILNIWTMNDGTVLISVPNHHYMVSVKDEAESPYTLVKQLDGTLDAFIQTDKGQCIGAVNDKGLCMFDKNARQWNPLNIPSLSKRISSLVETQGFIWVGSHDTGIQRIDLKTTNQALSCVNQPLATNVLGQSVNDIFFMTASCDGKTLWITSSDDIHAFSINDKGMLIPLDLTSELIGYMPQRKMLSELTTSRDGSIWVAGYDTESFIIDFTPHTTQRIDVPAMQERFKRSTLIVSLSQDDDAETYWLSQERVGLCLYQPKSGRLVTFSDNTDAQDADLYMVHEIIKSSIANRVWVVPTQNCIYSLENIGMRIRLADKVQLPTGQTPKTLYEDSHGRLWIGTWQGIFVYHPENHTLKPVDAKVGHTTSITQTADGTIWATVTGRGVAEIRDEQILKIHEQTFDLLSIASTTDGTLYVGTGEGHLLSADSKAQTLTFTDLSQSAGMNGNMVEKIVADRYNHLWILTNQRLIEFDPHHNTFRITETSGTSQNDAYTLSRFMPRAICADKKTGDILIGGFGGMLRMQPSLQIEGIARRVKVHLTAARIADSLYFNTEHLVAQRGQGIELHLSTLDHLHASTERYAYSLDGGDWVYLPTGQNQIHLHGLARGTHYLRLRATDENGLWSSENSEVVIERLPAWWETNLAFLLYTLTGGLLVFFLFRHLVMRAKKKEEDIWSDSAELMAMHHYVEGDTLTSEQQESSGVVFTQIDRMLLDKVKQTIEQNLSEPDFSVATLASHMNMSRSTLMRKLRAITGKTPLQFIRDVKMDIACQMLSNRTAGVADVAKRLGYSDREHFANTFREAIGVLPSEWQRNQLSDAHL